MARPQKYDRDEVLNSAMEVFRQQGYRATSVPNLVKATGLQPGSIYAAFGNKKGLLMEALDSYSAKNLADMDALLKSHHSPLESLFSFLKQTSKQCQSSGGKHGCLVLNMFLELSAQDDEIDGQLQKLINKIEQRLTTQIILAIDQGEVSSQQDPEALAKFVLTNIWGLRILGRRDNSEDIGMVVNQIIAYLKSNAENQPAHH